MGVMPNHVRVDQRGTEALAAIFDGFLADRIAFERIGAVAFGDMQARETADETRDAASGSLHLNRNGDGVTVVFDDIQERKLFRAGDVERFPELAFAGGAVSG